MRRQNLVTAVAAVVVLQICITEVDAQTSWCPPGSTPVAGGGGNMCLCPDGSYANINGCPQRHIRPPAQANIPPQPKLPDRSLQVAGAFEAFLTSINIWKRSQDKVVPTEWKTYQILNERQKENSIAAKPPPGFDDTFGAKNYKPPSNPNVTPTNPFGTSGNLSDVKGLSPPTTPIATATPTTLPPPGQLGANSGVTGFQPQTNTAPQNQSWGQKATNWFECKVLNRC
ncbi:MULTISPECIES: hypothetical protein [unclassified Bradyrhizobium]|uniref:hypothetical protein n=1 Tax=unclassified Bradyrhizobium TaxID=2631580 RepID=UPI001FFADB3B|nr:MULTISPECIES: hypothetical protein [unclassified Bradyrhizobium]MCK1348662.1 hypothetical protein [Bradyrhizobium sp. CW11]MCK1702374.1 hypothetical protein [Bradyrhizobium sp. 146]